MSKLVLTSIAAAALITLTACAEEKTDTEAAVAASKPFETTKAEPIATEAEVETVDAQKSVMDQPVNFSSPEDIQITLHNIQQYAGEKTVGEINNVIDYLLVYDLSVNRSKDKLYKKLDGKTPNEILAIPSN